MATEQSFLNAIRDVPNDDDLRLIFADWLEERDDLRGKLMRSQVVLRHTKRRDPRRPSLRRETTQIVNQFKDWLDYVPGSGRVRFIRGLLHLTINGDYLATLLEEKQTHPRILPWLSRLELTRLNRPSFMNLMRLLAAKSLHALTGLNLYGMSLDAEHLTELLASPATPYLTSLILLGTGITDPNVALLASSPRLSRVRSLGLNDNRLTPEGVHTLTASPVLTQLVALDLCRNHFGAEGAQVLAASPQLRQLRVLQLYGTQLGATGMGYLAESPNLSSLRKLNLRENQLGPEGFERLALSSRMGSLVELSLCRNHIGPDGYDPLFRNADRWPNLRRLYATGESIDDQTIARFLASPLSRSFTHLDLRYNQITDVGITMLAQSRRMRHLRCLRLSDNAIGTAGARALATSPYLKQIRQLELGSVTLDEESFALLRQRFGKRLSL